MLPNYPLADLTFPRLCATNTDPEVPVSARVVSWLVMKEARAQRVRQCVVHAFAPRLDPALLAERRDALSAAKCRELRSLPDGDDAA